MRPVGTRYALETKGREGVAVILVVGLISVLMLSAVAFSISMRIERRGAANLKHSVRARHMLHSAVAMAIDDINRTMDNGTDMDLALGTRVMVTEDEGDSVRARVLSLEAEEYIPSCLYDDATNATPYWRAVTNQDGTVWGRYAYMVLDCSGLLDANKAGGSTRAGGESPAELQFESPTFVANSDLFGTNRTTYLSGANARFETLSELVRWCDSEGWGWPANFVVYSLAPMHHYMAADKSTQRRAYVGADTSLWDRDAIIAGFVDCGLTEGGANLTYSNLLDYVDSDSEPQSLADGHVDRFPMVNEVVIDYYGEADASSYTYEYEVIIEWFYPFVTPSSDSFIMTAEVNFTPGPVNTYGWSIPTNVPATDHAVGLGSQTHAHGIVSFAGNGTIGGQTLTNAFNVDIEAEVKVKIKLASGTEVDSVPYPYGDDGVMVKISGVVNPGGSGIETNDWAECIDPVYNGDADADPIQWLTKENRPDYEAEFPGFTATETATAGGAPNSFTTHILANLEQGASVFEKNFDGDTYMHVANEPLTRVGELGNLRIKEWYTVRLYDHDVDNLYVGEAAYHPVIDRFTVHGPDAPYARGLVNINSENLDVLASVFYNVPLEEYAGSTDTIDTWTKARNIADAVYTNGLYTGVSQIGEIGGWASLVNGSNELAMEGPIRNSSELLTVRQNLFTLLVRAESYSVGMGGIGGTALASQHAVAQVWRDPFRSSGSSTNHPCFIRLLKVLEN